MLRVYARAGHGGVRCMHRLRIGACPRICEGALSWMSRRQPAAHRRRVRTRWCRLLQRAVRRSVSSTFCGSNFYRIRKLQLHAVRRTPRAATHHAVTAPELALQRRYRTHATHTCDPSIPLSLPLPLQRVCVTPMPAARSRPAPPPARWHPRPPIPRRLRPAAVPASAAGCRAGSAA